MPRELFDIFDGHPFDGGHCFLCGQILTPDNRTEEHVFPRWLQETFNIRDKTLNLLNNSRIPYRNLVIPCCLTCNGGHLSQLERKIRDVITAKNGKLSDIADKDLNAWLSKIYLGVLWKELELHFDRRNPEAGYILPKSVMTNFRMVHFFLQSCRKSMSFHGLEGRFPNTILRLECNKELSSSEFDYMDDMHGHSIGIRMGSHAIIAVFDGGLHDFVYPDFAMQQFEQKPLNPMQFREVFAKITYKSQLCERVPFYGFAYDSTRDHYDVAILAFDSSEMSATLLVTESETEITMAPVVPPNLSEIRAYGPWSQEDYARLLSRYLEAPFEYVYRPPNLVITTLRDENGEFLSA